MTKKLTTDEFIIRAKAVHGDNYDYSLTNYINSYTKVKIICPIHGGFEQRSGDHLKGKGCYKCGRIKKTTKKFIDEAIITHGNKYDYSLVDYISAKIKVKIICPIHGEFEQRSSDHLEGKGCYKCGTEKAKKNKTKTTEEFIEKAKSIHGNLFDYSDVVYEHWSSKINIKCRKHGTFTQSPSEHLKGCGCPICKFSKGEKEINKFLDENGVIYESQYKFNGCKNKKKLPFDFYLPYQNICIEYDGRQHYESIEHFGGKGRLLETQKCDSIKTKFCEDNNIKLIRIKHNENIIEKLKAML